MGQNSSMLAVRLKDKFGEHQTPVRLHIYQLQVKQGGLDTLQQQQILEDL